MSKFMECPACGEIELEHVDTLTGQGKKTLEYKCRCGEVLYFNSPLPHTDKIALAFSREKYPGVRAAMSEVGYDVLDGSSMQDVFTLGWIAGRLYEAKKNRELIKKAADVPIMLRKQAE